MTVESKISYQLPDVKIPHLITSQLNVLETSFKSRAQKGKQISHRLSRYRLWLVFALVRHGGLRLGEALFLDEEKDIDFDSGQLRVNGSHTREVPLQNAVVMDLKTMLSAPMPSSVRGQMARLDPGYVRRNFYARAEECNLPPELASPKALRQARAVELLKNGMPLPAVSRYLGQPNLESTADLLAYSDTEINDITRYYMQREARLKTSARNIFPGEITGVVRSGFMVEVVVKSFTGLEIFSIITQDSYENMTLAIGKIVIATVKAPWVVLLAKGTHTAATRNCFQGNVIKINRSDVVCEVEVRLQDDSVVCSIITTSSADALNIKPEQSMFVLFKEMSVILSLP